MTPKDKEKFIEIYRDNKCLAEALEKFHISEYAVRCELGKDETFARKFREIAKIKARKGGRTVTDEMRRERKEKFLQAYAEGHTFMDAIKIAGFSTHSFQTAKENDAKFAESYAIILRGKSCGSVKKTNVKNKTEENRTETEYKGATKICARCGKELPIVYFYYGKRKTCTDCCKERRIELEKKRKLSREEQKLIDDIRDSEKLCFKYSRMLDAEKYIEESRRLFVLKQKYESMKGVRINEAIETYHINLS